MLLSLEYNYGEEVKEFANLLIGSTVCGEQYVNIMKPHKIVKNVILC